MQFERFSANDKIATLLSSKWTWLLYGDELRYLLYNDHCNNDDEQEEAEFSPDGINSRLAHIRSG